MANRNTHIIAGIVAGGGAALYISKEEPDPMARALQVLGGVVGGYHGGMLPDVLEPADSPNHRSVVHSVLIGGASLGAIVMRGEGLLERMHKRVLELENELALATDPWRRFLLALGIAFCHLAIGYGVGLSSGYASHLILDGTTPRSLPLLG